MFLPLDVFYIIRDYITGPNGSDSDGMIVGTHIITNMSQVCLLRLVSRAWLKMIDDSMPKSIISTYQWTDKSQISHTKVKHQRQAHTWILAGHPLNAVKMMIDSCQSRARRHHSCNLRKVIAAACAIGHSGLIRCLFELWPSYHPTAGQTSHLLQLLDRLPISKARGSCYAALDSNGVKLKLIINRFELARYDQISLQKYWLTGHRIIASATVLTIAIENKNQDLVGLFLEYTKKVGDLTPATWVKLEEFRPLTVDKYADDFTAKESYEIASCTENKIIRAKAKQYDAAVKNLELVNQSITRELNKQYPDCEIISRLTPNDILTTDLTQPWKYKWDHQQVRFGVGLFTSADHTIIVTEIFNPTDHCTIS